MVKGKIPEEIPDELLTATPTKIFQYMRLNGFSREAYGLPPDRIWKLDELAPSSQTISSTRSGLSRATVSKVFRDDVNVSYSSLETLRDCFLKSLDQESPVRKTWRDFILERCIEHGVSGLRPGEPQAVQRQVDPIPSIDAEAEGKASELRNVAADPIDKSDAAAKHDATTDDLHKSEASRLSTHQNAKPAIFVSIALAIGLSISFLVNVFMFSEKSNNSERLSEAYTENAKVAEQLRGSKTEINLLTGLMNELSAKRASLAEQLSQIDRENEERIAKVTELIREKGCIERRFFESQTQLIEEDDLSRIERIMNDAAEGDLEAITIAGNLYEAGTGDLERSLARAFCLYQISADNGYADAQFYLGNLMGLEVMSEPASTDVAADLLRRAADQGNRKAQYVLSQWYAMGRGVRPSATEAVKRLIEASDQEHPTAKVCLAIHHLTGRFVSFSEVKAKELLFGTEIPQGIRVTQMIKSFESATDTKFLSTSYASSQALSGLAEDINCFYSIETE